MLLAEASAILRNLHYKHVWKFHCYPTKTNPDHVRLVVQFDAADADHPSQRFQASWAGMEEIPLTEMTQRQLLEAVHRTLSRLESHEIFENLRIGDDQVPVFSPHTEDGRACWRIENTTYFEDRIEQGRSS